MTWVTCDPTCGAGNFGAAQHVGFTRMLMSNVRSVYYDLQAKNCEVAVQVTTCIGRGYISAAALQATQLVWFSLVCVQEQL